MRTIDVPYIRELSASGMKEIIGTLQLLPHHALSSNPWNSTHQPEVYFCIAFDDAHVYLRYKVRENNLRCVSLKANDPVFEDSCVEFFIAMPDDDRYYNFEWNSVGTCRAAYGSGRLSRQYFSSKTIQLIKTTSYIDVDSGQQMNWSILAKLPLGIFSFHNLITLKHTRCRANFYKCGDKLPYPHYLSWNHVNYPEPDFHRPDNFGLLNFF